MNRLVMDWALSVEGVPTQCVAVLIGLARHADRYGKGACPSADTLAGYARKSRRQVIKDLAALVEAGLIGVSDDQSAAAHIRADRRPKVYELIAYGVNSGSPRGAGSESSDGVDCDGPQGDVGSVRGDADDVSSGSPRTDGVNHSSSRESAQDGHGVNCGSHEEVLSVVTSVQNSPTKGGSSSSANADAPTDKATGRNDREDINRLCDLLADLVAENDANGLRPTITKRWRDAARLMIDRDGRDVVKAEALIRWSQQDDFWLSNVKCMPTFRRQYAQLRNKAVLDWKKAREPKRVPNQRPNTDERVAAVQSLKRGRQQPAADQLALGG